MQFKKNKGDKSKGCESCRPPGMSRMPGMSAKDEKNAMKRLKEMEKKRAKPMDCPFIKTCTFKMLPEVGLILCLDQEVGGRQGRGYMMHMSGQHAWMQCRQYAETLREDKGVLPKDMRKAIKARKNKK